MEVGGREEKGERKERRDKMNGQLVMALVIAIPIILIPAAFIWYLNISGIYTVIRETRKRRIAREKRMRTVAETK